MNENVFVRSRHNCLLLSFLIVFVDLVERCGLENFGSLWCGATTSIQIFEKKESRCKFLAILGWMLTSSVSPPSAEKYAGLARLYHGTFGSWVYFQK
jgi:hypothetical protein